MNVFNTCDEFLKDQIKTIDTLIKSDLDLLDEKPETEGHKLLRETFTKNGTIRNLVIKPANMENKPYVYTVEVLVTQPWNAEHSLMQYTFDIDVHTYLELETDDDLKTELINFYQIEPNYSNMKVLNDLLEQTRNYNDASNQLTDQVIQEITEQLENEVHNEPEPKPEPKKKSSKKKLEPKNDYPTLTNDEKLEIQKQEIREMFKKARDVDYRFAYSHKTKITPTDEVVYLQFDRHGENPEVIKDVVKPIGVETPLRDIIRAGLVPAMRDSSTFNYCNNIDNTCTNLQKIRERKKEIQRMQKELANQLNDINKQTAENNAKIAELNQAIQQQQQEQQGPQTTFDKKGGNNG